MAAGAAYEFPSMGNSVRDAKTNRTTAKHEIRRMSASTRYRNTRFYANWEVFVVIFFATKAARGIRSSCFGPHYSSHPTLTCARYLILSRLSKFWCCLIAQTTLWSHGPFVHRMAQKGCYSTCIVTKPLLHSHSNRLEDPRIVESDRGMRGKWV